MPGEYAAVGRPQGPDDWKGTDAIATAAVVGAIFGVGGGHEVESALALQDARKRFGRRRGDAVWTGFRSVDDPEARTSVLKKRFPYGLPPKRPRGVALPDRGSVRYPPTVEQAQAPGGTAKTTGALGKLAFPGAMSNALLVSAAESESGRPLAVFGPQTAYFAPQVLTEQDVHAPGIDARGVAFPGINLYVQIGHGRDYAWSATTSAQDIVDTFALDLCEPGGGKATLDSTHYLDRGRCVAMETLERSNSWQPNLADSTPAGSETLSAERTRLGIVHARGTVRGRPVAFVINRSTYRHEGDSGIAFRTLNDPGEIRGPRDFQRAAALVSGTFNWWYADSRSIAYQNAGANPRHAARTDPSLPIAGRRAYEWRGGRNLVESSTPPSAHPNAIDQPYFADWNGKQARGYGAADGNWGYGPVYRSRLLENRVADQIRGDRKTTLPQLTEAMADAATVDLRGDAVLRYALRVLGTPSDPALRQAVDALTAWERDGAHRIDVNGDGQYEHADAIRVMDAWWPRWVKAQFEPTLGARPVRADRARPRDRQPPEQPRRPRRIGVAERLVLVRAEGPPSGARRPRARMAANVLRPRQARGLPGRARAVAGRRADGVRRPGAVLRPGLRGPGPRQRAGLLRLDLAPPARRRHPAADPVAEPAHVPAGGGDPGHRSAVGAATMGAWPARRPHDVENCC